ncbi:MULTISPECIES: hypothetical protein [Pseudoalteromonas]|nr:MULTISPECIES: hypothetical protein [unclassified Pseudoalteromonas]MCG9759816.1 hypothetical protein [Pseudoalteromonas sp. Isolate6]
MIKSKNSARKYWLTGLVIAGTFSIVCSVIFSFVGGVVTKSPWVAISLFLLPLPQLFTIYKDLNDFGAIDKVSSTERERLNEQILELRGYMMVFLIITICFAVISVFVLFYNAHHALPLQYIAMLFGFFAGWIIYLMVTLFRMHNQVGSFKAKIYERAKKISIARASSKKLREKTQ